MLSAIAETLTGVGVGIGAADRAAEGGTHTTTDTATTAANDGPEDRSATPRPLRRAEGTDEATQTCEACTCSAAAGVVDDRGRSSTGVSAKPRKSSAEAHYLHREELRNLPGYPISGLVNPESAGATAALLAYASAKPVAIWHPNPNSTAGAAASLAHANRESGGSRPSPKAEPVTSDGSTPNWPLRGALGAIRGGRRRAESSPAVCSGIGGDVLGAATVAHTHAATGRRRDSGFGTTSDGEITAAEKLKADIRNAAVLSMANERLKREELADTPPPLPPSSSRPVRRAPYPNLEEAARRQAEQRLANIGYVPRTPGRSASLSSASRVMVRDRDRNRNRNQVPVSDQDVERAEKQKRGHDALLLMTAAKKNVQARLSLQDRQIAERKGIVCSDEWASRATEIAQRRLEQPRRPPGQVDIGGGAYMDKEELERIAERNVRPVIEDLNERAGEHRQLKQEKKEAKAQDRARKMSRVKDTKIFGGGKHRHGDENTISEVRRTDTTHRASLEHSQRGDTTVIPDRTVGALPMPPVPEKISTFNKVRARILRKTRGGKPTNTASSDSEYARPFLAPASNVAATDNRRDLTTAGINQTADRTSIITVDSEPDRPLTAPAAVSQSAKPLGTPVTAPNREYISAFPTATTASAIPAPETEEERRPATPPQSPRTVKEPANESWVARLFSKRSSANPNPEPATEPLEPNVPSPEPVPAPKHTQGHKHRASIGSVFFDRIRPSRGAEHAERPVLEERETEGFVVDRSNATGPTQVPAATATTMATADVPNRTETMETAIAPTPTVTMETATTTPTHTATPETATAPTRTTTETAMISDDDADSHEVYADAPTTPAASMHSEIIAQTVTDTIITKETVAVPIGSNADMEAPATPVFKSTTMETSSSVRDAEGNTLSEVRNTPVVLNVENSREMRGIWEVEGEASGMRESRFREEL
ncbi:hypothetical protein BZA05DRAFT_400576 [Tricharina praecox]|uniref:uncharacterized protein n=1 Tax=Tricharina praecox TaxID=43433 RepID=UPI00222030B5|nr:uncharacterized protein BZA05DRAFT_400576 [Tricharina praecox]KAI5850004.1 hypothetical protein BZA05DRAFT_400576 [Tricharina praecox]